MLSKLEMISSNQNCMLSTARKNKHGYYVGHLYVVQILFKHNVSEAGCPSVMCKEGNVPIQLVQLKTASLNFGTPIGVLRRTR
jgi:hypothetical protein